jgi:hypothetical protein
LPRTVKNNARRRGALQRCDDRGERFTDRVYQLDPFDWAHVEWLLDRLDAESLAGSAYADAARQRVADVNSELSDLEKLRPYLTNPPIEPLSLAMAERLTGEPKTDATTQIWEKWRQDPKTPVTVGYDPDKGKHVKDPYLAPRPTLGTAPMA